jgi:hypothetical protein
MHSADVEDQTDLGGDGVAQNVRFGEKLKNWRGPLVRPGDFHRYLPVSGAAQAVVRAFLNWPERRRWTRNQHAHSRVPEKIDPLATFRRKTERRRPRLSDICGVICCENIHY